MKSYTLDSALVDSAKSFYGKARVEIDGTTKTLISYDTKVAYIKDGKAFINGDYSATTIRHIKEFLAQENFPIGTKKEILEMYKKDV